MTQKKKRKSREDSRDSAALLRFVLFFFGGEDPFLLKKKIIKNKNKRTTGRAGLLSSGTRASCAENVPGRNVSSTATSRGTPQVEGRIPHWSPENLFCLFCLFVCFFFAVSRAVRQRRGPWRRRSPKKEEKQKTNGGSRSSARRVQGRAAHRIRRRRRRRRRRRKLGWPSADQLTFPFRDLIGRKRLRWAWPEATAHRPPQRPRVEAESLR